MKRRLMVIALACLGASPAWAEGCNPPAGLVIQQWVQICGPLLQQAYAMGMGQGLPFDAYVQSMYQVYAQPVMQPSLPSGGDQTCALGQTACFNGYVRTCQSMATGGTWWMTSPQPCN